MINDGEATKDDEFPEISNGSPDLSDFSSCGESEFERYCSANSVMGTPSLCSSVGTFNDFLDLDFGASLRNSADETVSTSGGLDCVIDGRRDPIEDKRMLLRDEDELEPQQSSDRKTSSHNSFYDDNGVEGLALSRVPTFGENHVSQVVGAKNNEENSTRMQTEPNDCSELVYNTFDPFDVKENGSVEDEETSSRNEHSDDGSMFNYGTDDEGRMDSYNLRNLQYFEDSKINNENPLLIGSSVAFGSEDWDDFMQEAESNLVSLSLDKPEDQGPENMENEGRVVNSVSAVSFNAPNYCKENPASCSTRYKLTQERDKLTQETNCLADKVPLKIGLNIMESAVERELQFTSSDVLVDTTLAQLTSSATIKPCHEEAVPFDDHKVHELLPAIQDDSDISVKEITKISAASVRKEEHLAPVKVGFEVKESYDEVVLEMEEILLDSMDTPGARFPQYNRSPQPFRDGSSTASTSGTDDAYPLVRQSLHIDGVEVVGARQKKGDVSLGERLVGVKEYTVYLVRVWSGKDHWEVERRYRDFFTLYRQLKTLYASHGWSLPTPWSRVEQESRKFFGNSSPNVVSERSTLIQECLRSILHCGTPNSAPGTLNWFLSPQKAISSSTLLNTLVPQSTSAFTGGTFTEDVPTFGKTISLLVELQPRKSVKQLLEAQHFICAGCHKRLDTEKSLVQGFVHTLGWGKPRLCEYTGQLYCTSCHTNDTAVLPARVLHFWDFTEYPVSQMAKSYLDSIYDQPMLCVSAVNPFLFSKVPALLHVMSIRKRIGAMMPYVRCPFRRSILRGVGSRRYLLQNNEFFALKDLIDLSKGAFSALPVMVETVSTKIVDHITQQCLICCEVGIPCGARQACEDPSALIFPFQEDEVKRCKFCVSVFHRPCFRKLPNCPCGAGSEVGKTAAPEGNVSECSNETLVKKSDDSGYPVKFLSYLFSKKRQEKELGRQNSNPVILMSSLPSSFSDPL